MQNYARLFTIEIAKLLSLYNLYRVNNDNFDHIISNMEVSYNGAESAQKDFCIGLTSLFDFWVRTSHRCIDLRRPASSKILLLALWLFNFSSIREAERLSPLLIPAHMVSQYTDRVTLWGVTQLNPENMSRDQNHICDALTAAKILNFSNFFDSFTRIRFRPNFLSLVGLWNFRNHLNQLHAILVHASPIEISFLKNHTKSDTIFQTAIQQALHVKMNPLLEMLRDGSIPDAIDLLNQPEPNEGDFSLPNSPVVIVIDGDQDNSDRESLPDLDPIPPLPAFPRSPAPESPAPESPVPSGYETAEDQIF